VRRDERQSGGAMRFFYAVIRSGRMYSKAINALSKSYSRSAQERDSGGESL